MSCRNKLQVPLFNKSQIQVGPFSLICIWSRGLEDKGTTCSAPCLGSSIVWFLLLGTRSYAVNKATHGHSQVREGTGRSVSLAVTRETRLPLRQGHTDGRRRKHRVQSWFSPTDSKQRENSWPHAEMAPWHSNSFCGTPLKVSIGFPPSLLIISFLLKKQALYGS